MLFFGIKKKETGNKRDFGLSWIMVFETWLF
jgi:hypothetical protein